MSETRDEFYARAIEEMRQRGPLCPADLDAEVWAAVAANYPGADWAPGPNYHVEYRDARIAAQMMMRKLMLSWVSTLDDSKEVPG